MIKFSGLLKKRDDMTTEEFSRYWLEVHVPIVLKTPGIKKYNVNIVDRTQTPDALIDGFSELWFESVEAMNAALNSEEFRKVKEDVPNFQKDIDRIVIKEHVIIP